MARSRVGQTEGVMADIRNKSRVLRVVQATSMGDFGGAWRLRWSRAFLGLEL